MNKNTQHIKFFCINLKRRTDRWKEVKNIFRNIGLEVEKVEACDIKENPEMGCALSHKKIIKKSLRNKYPFVCVFEDDIKIYNPETFMKKLRESIEELPDNWGILYLGGLISREGTLKFFSPHLLKVTGLMCTYAIIYNKPSYSLILKECQKGIKDYGAIDIWLANNIQQRIPCFIVNQLLVGERGGSSDIQKGQNKNKNFIYKIRFLLYKYNFRGILVKLGKIGDILGISNRSRTLKKRRKL